MYNIRHVNGTVKVIHTRGMSATFVAHNVVHTYIHMDICINTRLTGGTKNGQ